MSVVDSVWDLGGRGAVEARRRDNGCLRAVDRGGLKGRKRRRRGFPRLLSRKRGKNHGNSVAWG